MGLNSVVLLVCLLGMTKGLSDLRAEFLTFVKVQGRDYGRAELKMRYNLFTQTDLFVSSTNNKHLGFVLEKNKFSDYTLEEKKMLGGLNHTIQSWSQHHASAGAYQHYNPTSVDWVAKGVVSPVENQGRCGSCYIFSTLHVLESRIAQYNGAAVQQLSEQHVLDCIYQYTGCGGGFIDDVLSYVKKGKPVTSDQALPYTGNSDISKCQSYDRYNNELKDVFLEKWNNGQTNRALEDFVAAGPTSVSISITDELTYYKTGIIDVPGCSPYADHALVGTGYTREYWVIKNSWGADWGDKGYFKLTRRRPNMCGVDVWSYQAYVRNRKCSSTEFECGDGKCLPMSQKCDGVKQCSDGSDEPKDCNPDGKCTSNFFTCKKDHQCIPFYWQCDGRNDCRDGTDEDSHCDEKGNCNVFEFECADKAQCIAGYEKCDGYVQCNDGSDEGAICDSDPTPAPTKVPTDSPAPTDGPTPAPTDGPTPAPTPAPTDGPTDGPTPDDCEDKDRSGWCPYWARSGSCEVTPVIMRTHCESSCGFCGKVECVDKDSYCPNWSAECQNYDYVYYLGYNCRKTCNLC